ncbi:MAG: hypothetical protein JJ885_15055 [Muricauda sp.]|nr:hypothetical protein [Allomuricauda sp.]MBO6531714.1 hypothetical protein [Allomuricauda sp.]MBO6587603.1 hypothetical protein [Allomuricauda sp.]MBO6617228.1 hypothetical protein [Allomuricauda sp.]MBO6643761.1 hypothetical protein [Allomuricauda sp.]MBO6745563.1 hypothetical protein [Allomuricauda sp.]
MNKPHIMLNCPDEFPDELVEKITSEIKAFKLNLQVNKIPNEPFAAIEWTIPGIIAIFVAQSYFGGFLSEFGKDHYETLKKWLKRNAIDSRKMNVRTITADISTNKIDKTNTQSKAFSIYIQTADNRSLKLLFDLNLSDSIWESSIDEIIELAYDNSKNYPNDKLTEKLTELDKDTRNIYAIIDPKNGEWEFLDGRKLALKIKNKNFG